MSPFRVAVHPCTRPADVRAKLEELRVVGEGRVVDLSRVHSVRYGGGARGTCTLMFLLDVLMRRFSAGVMNELGGS